MLVNGVKERKALDKKISPQRVSSWCCPMMGGRMTCSMKVGAQRETVVRVYFPLMVVMLGPSMSEACLSLLGVTVRRLGCLLSTNSQVVFEGNTLPLSNKIKK
jgi:hypothetical protein